MWRALMAAAGLASVGTPPRIDGADPMTRRLAAVGGMHDQHGNTSNGTMDMSDMDGNTTGAGPNMHSGMNGTSNDDSGMGGNGMHGGMGGDDNGTMNGAQNMNSGMNGSSTDDSGMGGHGIHGGMNGDVMGGDDNGTMTGMHGGMTGTTNDETGMGGHGMHGGMDGDGGMNGDDSNSPTDDDGSGDMHGGMGGGMGGANATAECANTDPAHSSRYGLVNGTCHECPIGLFSAVENGHMGPERVCARCEAGRAGMDHGVQHCFACGRGLFNAELGRTECDACLAGTFAHAPGQTACAECQPGRAARDAAARECADCEAGRFSVSNRSTACTACAPGSYTDVGGMTACIPCGHPSSHWTTLHKLAGHNQWIMMEAAANVSSCSCQIDMRLEDGACVRCGEGLRCPGMSETIVEPSYYAGTDLSIFKCHLNPRRCVGGLPGQTCAAGRAGIACALCVDGATPDSETEYATCRTCAGPDVAVFVFACLGAFFLLAVTYYLVATQADKTQGHAMLLLAMAFSLLITSMQTFGVIGMLSIDFIEPLKSVLAALSVIMFDMEVLHIDCISTSPPTIRYLQQILVLAVCLALFLALHFSDVACRHQRRFAHRMPLLISSLGTLVMACYITVLSTVLQPLQCMKNPNHISTMGSHQSVICWTGGQHSAMLGIAAVALLVPIGYLAACCLIVHQYPGRVACGDTTFLVSWRFLFFRFRSETYWFGLVHMFRSLLLSLAPAVPNAVGQIVVVQVVMLTQLMLTLSVAPWRVKSANILEVFLTLGFLVVMMLTAFLVNDDVSGPIAWSVTAMILCMLVSLPIACGFGTYMYVMHRRDKPFRYFICHHKVGAGSFARLLKMMLTTKTKKVFIDSDDLTDLDKLFDVVGSQTSTCLALLSKEVLLRVWCMGELVTAQMNNIDTRVLVFPDYATPSEQFIEKYQEHVPNITVLTERSISVEMVQTALSWVDNLSGLRLPRNLSGATLESITLLIGPSQSTNRSQSSQLTSIEYQRDVAPPSATTATIVDHSNGEAVAAALVLRLLLVPRFACEATHTPYVLMQGETLPRHTKKLLLFLTNGAFQSAPVLQCLMTGVDLEASHVLIMAEEKFRFPTESFVQESLFVAAAIGVQPEVLSKLVSEVCKSIAIVFQPDSSNAQALEMKAGEVENRLTCTGVSRAAKAVAQERAAQEAVTSEQATSMAEAEHVEAPEASEDDSWVGM